MVSKLFIWWLVKVNAAIRQVSKKKKKKKEGQDSDAWLQNSFHYQNLIKIDI